MLKRRVTRLLTTGFLLTVALSGLTACKTSPNVAAYVGDAQVTVSELEAAVADRLADEGIAQWAADPANDLSRQVLGLLVAEEVHAAAAERYDVRVEDAEVRRRVDAVIGARDPDAFYQQIATRQGGSRADVVESIRQQLVRERIAEAEGLVEETSEAGLQARYEEVREGLGEVEFGFITVPDQAAADAVLRQLTADPSAYPALAGRYAGPYTLPDLQTRPAEDAPAPLAEGVASAEPNTGFTTEIPEVPGVIVTFVADKVYPEFEEIRPRLEQEAAGQAAAAGGELVQEVGDDLGVTINPRYDLVFEEGRLVPAEGGVVDILGAGAAPSGN